jgi:ferritin-like metal-binding protein YciE
MNTALHNLFVDELQDIYDAEQQLVEALPKLAKAAETDELREAFESHLKETEGHVSRLEQVFESLNEKPKRKKCHGIAGIINEGEKALKEQKDSEALDAALIAGAQKAEHYEIATYGTLCNWADLMDHQDAFELLQQNLDEEKEADRLLSEIAESVNGTS